MLSRSLHEWGLWEVQRAALIRKNGVGGGSGCIGELVEASRLALTTRRDLLRRKNRLGMAHGLVSGHGEGRIGNPPQIGNLPHRIRLLVA